MTMLIVPPAYLARICRFCALMLDHPNVWVQVVGSRDMEPTARDILLHAIEVQANRLGFEIVQQYRPDDVYVCRVDDTVTPALVEPVKPTKTPGQVAYEAFRYAAKHASNWNMCHPKLKEAWEFAAEQVLKAKESLN